VVHAPHRWYALEEEIHGVNQLRIVGGVSNCCLQHGLNFYDGREVIPTSTSSSTSAGEFVNNNNNNTSFGAASTTVTSPSSLSPSSGVNSSSSSDPKGTSSIARSRPSAKFVSRVKSLGIPMHPVSSVEVAELTKIVENAHRYLQIAFAEELYLYSKANGISFSELRESLNTKWNVEILEPRDGIGGHCLPKDTKMFINSSNTIKSKILQAAMEIDEDYRAYFHNTDKPGIACKEKDCEVIKALR
jgi:UDP-N-acetyl-D-mannosaminuronate dehydrogenase